MTDSESLYALDFGTRPLMALAAGLGATVLFAVVAIATGIFGVLALSLLALVGGVFGFLRTTARLDVRAGQVTKRSRLGTRTFDAADLTVEAREGNVFVLAEAKNARNVVCVFKDADTERVQNAFATAGVAVAAAAAAQA